MFDKLRAMATQPEKAERESDEAGMVPKCSAAMRSHVLGGSFCIRSIPAES